MAGREVEIKLRLASAAEGRRRLREAGFRLARRRVFEANTLFDDAQHRLYRSGMALRVREVNGRVLLTYKGPAEPGRHKSREEIETAFDNPAALRAILERLGYRPVFRYEKYRAEYTDGKGVATVDETPVGFFLELEGAPSWIDRTARALGFRRSDYITASYSRLQEEHCAKRGEAVRDMVFGARRRGRV
jgi:adenylate cyclase class 2